MGIAITGIGVISAIGNGADATLASLRQKQSGIGEVRHLPTCHRGLPVGEVDDSDNELKHGLGIAEDTEVSRTVLLGATALREAIADAGIDKVQCQRMVLVSGTTVGGMDVTERYFGQLAESDEHLQPVMSHDCGSSTEATARYGGICGVRCTTVSTACSSALNAIAVGAELLSRGEADVVVAGGSEALSLFHLNGFNSLMILSHERCRPFDATRNGLNLGEGAAYVVMQRSDDATGRVYGYVAGYGNACDAYHQTASSPDGEGAYRAMSEALAMCGVKPEDIDYVNAHGTATENNDSSESAALRRLFGDAMPPVSSTKGYTGHTTSASGAIEVVISLLAMQYGFVPANVGYNTADITCIEPSMGIEGVSLRRVLCNSFGFGGNDSSLLLSLDEPKYPWPSYSQSAVVAADVVIDNSESLAELRQYIPILETRRMGKLLKAATLSSLQALRNAGIDAPDAVIAATRWGMLETSERFLSDMCQGGETMLKPSLFMQSTHNTIASAIAIRTRCQGYNITYSHGSASLDWALDDARRLIAQGKARSVLVGLHDESTPMFADICRRLGCPMPYEVYSRSILLTTD